MIPRPENDNPSWKPEFASEAKFPPDKLDIFTSADIQREIDDMSDELAVFLGLDREKLEIYREFILNLRGTLKKMQEGAKAADAQPPEKNKNALAISLTKQKKAFQEMVQGDLPEGSPWRVRVSFNFSLLFSIPGSKLTFGIYDRGICIDSPNVDIDLNDFPAEEEDPDSISPVPKRSQDVYISIRTLNPEALGLPAPVTMIDSRPSVTGSGVIELFHTDSSRSGSKPHLGEGRIPHGMATGASYDKNGKLRYLKLLFHREDYGEKSRTKKIIWSFYDLRNKTPQSYMQPDLVEKMIDKDKIHLDELPEISVDESQNSINLSFLGHEDTLPVSVPSAIEIVRTVKDNLTRILREAHERGGNPELLSGLLGLEAGKE